MTTTLEPNTPKNNNPKPRRESKIHWRRPAIMTGRVFCRSGEQYVYDMNGSLKRVEEGWKT